jgi:predicted phage gp36 major capsid-like protein
VVEGHPRTVGRPSVNEAVVEALMVPGRRLRLPRRPTGQRGWWMHRRVGGNLVNASAARLKKSA